MKKENYHFIIISLITFLLLTIFPELSIHFYIIKIGKLLKCFPSFSTSFLDNLLISSLPYLSYFLIKDKFRIKIYLLNLLTYFLVNTIFLVIFILISKHIYKPINPLFPEYIIIISFKYYFCVAILLGIISTTFFMRFLLRRNDKNK
jgi:hypothetical protein